MRAPVRILLLEDNPHDAELAQRQLRRGGIEPAIRRVSSEGGFRSELITGNHDVILADYHLPDFDGFKALQIAQELAPEIPFIFVSGSIGEELAIEALLHGAADYILKDRPTRLSAAVKAALEQRRERDTKRSMNDALVDSEQRFHFVAVATRDVIWDWNIDADTMWVNDALRTEWGWVFEDGQVNYDTWCEKIHPHDLARVTESLKRAIDSDIGRWSGEYRFRRADRSYGFVFDRRVINRRPGGPAVRIIGAMQDVTERKTFEMRALDAERLAHLGTFSFDRIRQWREWSDEMYRIWDYPPGETITDEKVLARIHPDDRTAYLAATQKPKPFADFRLRLMTERGLRIIDVRLVSERDESGAFMRMFGTAQDITQRVESESRISELSRINRLILDNAVEGIVALSRSETLLFANPAARRMLGWDVEEPSASVHAQLHPNDPLDQECELLADLRARAARSGETTLNARDGRHLEVRYTSAPIVEDGEVRGCVVTFADITERKLLERQLAQVNRVSGLGRVAATIAHEFNNVLMGIQPFSEVIRRRSDDEMVVKAAAQIATSVVRGSRVTEEILRFTQPADPSRQPIVVEKWLRNILPELQSLAGQRIEVVLRVSDRAPAISGDPAQLQQVITNLVLNARDAIAATGVITIAVRDETSVEESLLGRIAPGLLMIAVEDTGGGMKPDVLRQIFDPLFTTKRTGTGLGLAVAQQVITRHGGSIHAESTPGKGTTFFILLPTTSVSEPAEAAVPSPDVAIRRLLLVEDEAAVATGIAMLLESEGVKVKIVERGTEVMDAIASFDPDVVVLDISLPDIDGTTVYQRIAATRPSLPVLFSSGHADESAFEKYFTTDRVGFLRKPYAFDALIDAIEMITRKSAAESH